MKMPASSRRTFLKRTIAGVTAALGDLHKLALAADPSSFKATMAQAGETQAGVASVANGAEYTRGVGVYPGDPHENFAPTLAAETGTTYRNLALLRPAYHSSSYDYNLTAQLLTDGIKHAHLPHWVETSTSLFGALARNEREFFLDHNATSGIELRGASPWVQVYLGGGKSVPEIDRVDLLIALNARNVAPADVSFAVSVSDDGWNWKTAGAVKGPEPSPPGGRQELLRWGYWFNPSIPLSPASQSRFYRMECTVTSSAGIDFGVQWKIEKVSFFNRNQRVEVGGPYNFTSAWKSHGLGEEWVYVDLGGSCEFNRVVLYWIAKAAEGSLQVSDDAENWRDIRPLPGGTSQTDDLKLSEAVRGRYVRVLMTRPSPADGYILSEMEVYGRGGFTVQPKPAPPAGPDGRIELAGGNWRLQRDSLVSAGPEAISKAGFDDKGWIVATVPGTVLTSYLNVGAIPDPNYSRNQLFISDSFFYADFWYRTEFESPRLRRGQRAWLNFDGINWKAEIFLNDARLGRIEGGFMRGRFDVTEHLLPGRKQMNALAVRIIKNDTPGSVKQKTLAAAGRNGGALGLDNPTFHASVGWDWISTIRGRNTGIWNSVYLTFSGPVTIANPFVTTTLPLPDTSHADVSIEIELANHTPKRVKGTLRGRIGRAKFRQHVTLEAFGRSTVKLDPSTHSALRLRNPKLWWPSGYGEPCLYDLELKFEAHRRASDTKRLKVGVRQMAYSQEGGALRIWINGRRLAPKGGNWGFSESMLRYRAREYDVAVRYHSEMHFNMIRNWVGQTGRDEFYDACDRYGVMVWQDFWLANPGDGPNPKDDRMFLRNAQDTILRLRNHPSMALYCGRNEGNPPKALEDGLTKMLAELHPGIQYISDSASGVVSGHGPYSAKPFSFYFGPGANERLHSERGMPAIPPMDSVRMMMPNRAMWPQGLDWGLHDFCLEGAANGASYRSMLESSYGGADSAKEWIALAQFINYDGYRAMFEGQSRRRMGLLIWMSHSCWPSFVWQTYDYYFEPTAAYFGAKKGCEPLHIQWNPDTESIEVVNYSAGNLEGLTARVELLNMNGSRHWEKTASLDSKEDSTVSCIKMEYPGTLTPVHFLRLTLAQNGKTLSTNFYLRPREADNYRAIRELPRVNLEASTRVEQQGGRWLLATEVRNSSAYPALLVRVKAVRETSGDRILPALYNDNYVDLLPGERRTIRTEVANADARGEKPGIVVEGFNVGKATAT
ncbi:MAG TPA: discoidin domain-containing protein [Terriglobia bacterium]|nr:discoidin domain-containing protein [Terriglobia bacterium]